MGNRNKRLLLIIAVLLVINLLFFFSKKSGTGKTYEDDLFAVQDTSGLKSIGIGDILLERSGGWKVGEHPADPSFVDHLINVLQRVRINKPVGQMPEEGTEVSINGEASFYFQSNETKTKTYFISNGEGYEVGIPGFTDYLGGIFELEADQWRDRLVYDGSWRTIQKLTLDYTQSDIDDFSIQFEEDFFKIGGVAEIDTAAMMDYLNQFQYFQANERIRKGRIEEMDSMVLTEPLALLTIDDINIKEVITLEIFNRRPQDPFHLLLDPNGEMIAVDVPRVANLLSKKSNFKASK